MDTQTIHVLLLEDSPTDALLVREELAHAATVKFVVAHVEMVGDALQRLKTSRVDVILSDLGLPDSDGIETFARLHGAMPDMPIIILSGRDDEMMAINAVHAGAQDYLVKGRGAESGLERSIRYAIERARAQATITAHARQQDALAVLGQQALAGADVAMLFDHAVRVVANTVKVEFCKVMELQATGEKLLLRAGVGWRDGLVGSALIDGTAGSAAGAILRGESPLVVEQLDADPRFGESSLLREHGVVSGISVPIQGRHKPWGILGAHTTRRRIFTENEMTFLQAVAHVLGEAIERKAAEQALHESDARFHQVVENIHEALWMFEPETKRVVYVSPRYAEIWGRPGGVLRESADAWFEQVHPDDRERVQAAAPAMERGGGRAETYRIVRPDGAVRWIRHRTFAARDSAGVLRRLISVAEDTTEQKKLEEQFLRSQRMEAIGTLASGVAHDLNNILAPILMTAELLTTRAPPGRDRELLAMMTKGAQRAAETVKQLLLFSRGVEGKRGLVQVRHLLKEMAGIMRETFPREIAILEQPASDLWPVVADATQLHQVLMNLCVNARDAMPNGGILTLSATNIELGPDDLHVHLDASACRYTLLTVADTGHGIPPEIINRIFDPFFTTKGAGKGSGLGLSTVAGIMRSHGGFITVASEPGHGTVFRAYLPAAGESALSATMLTPPPAPLGRGELVLVVDDEVAICEATREILEQHQYRVVTALDGREGMDVFLRERDQIRLVLTDLMMPVMSGVALVRALRALDPNLKIIAASGLEDAGKRTELAALGVTDVLMKPYVPAQLFGALRRHLASGRSAMPWEANRASVTT
ncbi:MAG: response regulator [Opitutaceae bacterium]|nr:response regulator [Opitutaceae bacterium]